MSTHEAPERTDVAIIGGGYTGLAAARSLARDALPEMRRRGVTMVGITVQGLGDGAAVQLELPIGRSSPALDRALDQVRERFGNDAIRRGRARVSVRSSG